MTIEDSIALFLDSKVAEGTADATVRWYRPRLQRLAEFLGSVALERVEVADLRRFLLHLREQRERYQHSAYRRPVEGALSASTINGYVRAIKRLFNWLEAEGRLGSNPARRLKLPPRPKQPPKATDPETFKLLLQATEGDTPAQKRDRALLLFLADTGCRVAGAVGLKLSDLDQERGMALVTEKGSKSRFVMFTQATRAALAEWLTVRPVESVWVFPNLFTGEQLLTTTVNHTLNRIKERAGAEGRCNPHSFRHAFARHYLLSGGDLASLSDLLGHEDIKVTKDFYSVFLVEELREKHNRHSPVAHLETAGGNEDNPT